MEANEFVGYTLPVVNIGPYSNFQNESIEPEGAGYTLTTIVPEQTITPNESRQAIPEDEFSLEQGKFYLVTLDDTEYFTTCASMWTENQVIGDSSILFEFSLNSISYPFCAVTTDNAYEIYFVDTDSHTIKIELFEFESTEFVGFTLPVVNEGPWSYFSNGGNSEDGEDETMLVSAAGEADDYPSISEDIDNPDNPELG